jgi:hypothetical protein
VSFSPVSREPSPTLKSPFCESVSGFEYPTTGWSSGVQAAAATPIAKAANHARQRRPVGSELRFK